MFSRFGVMRFWLVFSAIVFARMISQAQAGPLSYSDIILAGSPQYYWNWNGTGNTEANAATSGGAGGTLVGGTSATRATSTSTTGGLSLGTGASFGGNANYKWYTDATHGINPSDGTYSSYAIEFWLNLNSTGGQYISDAGQFSVTSSTDLPSVVYGFSGNGLEVFTNSGRTGSAFGALATGPWYHIVIGHESKTISGLESDQQTCIIDGNVAGKKTSTAVQTGYDAHDYLAFGIDRLLSGTPLSGMLDEYAVYNLSSLTDSQYQAKLSSLASHYSATVPEPGTLALLIAGLLSLLAYAWRKRR